MRKAYNSAIFNQYAPTIISFMLMAVIFTSRLALSVKSISLVISLVLILSIVPLKDILKTYTQNPIARGAALLYGCFIIGTTYSHATFSEQIHVLKSYLPLLWIGLLIAFFQSSKLSNRFSHQQTQIYSSVFIYGATLVTLLGCLNAWGIVDIVHIIRDKITTDAPEYPFGTFSFSLSFAAYLSAQKMRYASKGYYRYLFCFLFLTFFIFFVNHHRTAYITYDFLLLLYGYQHLGIKGIFTVAMGLLFLTFLALTESSTFKARTSEAVHDVKIYRKGNPISSTGLRLFFIKTSYSLWKEKPLFGYGTGSFKAVYLSTHGYNAYGQISTPSNPLDQPHNDYAYIAVQLGLFGLGCFLWLLINQLFYANQLPSFEKQCAQAFTLSFMLCAIDTTLLFYGTSITDYFFFTSLFYASVSKKLTNT